MAAFRTFQSLNKKKKLKWRHTVAFVFAYLAWSNTDSRLSHANEIVRYNKKSPRGNGHKLKEGVLRGQTCARGLSVSGMLLKSTFKLQAISVRYYLLAMEGKMFDVRLNLEFSGVVTDMPIVEWVKNVELVCKLCAMKNVEHVLSLRLRGRALAIYRQLSAEQKVDAEQIKHALITMYATDVFNAYDQFVTQQLRPGETLDKFFAELRWLAWLVGGPLPERWLTCAFVSGLPRHVKHLLHASSRMETMNVEQLLTRARAVMTDDEGPAELAAASTRRIPSESKMRSDDRKFACYRCGGPNHMAKDCLQDCQERLDHQMRKASDAVALDM